MGHLKGFSPECSLMWRNRFPFWVKEAPHWLHWNGLSPLNTWMDRGFQHGIIKLMPFLCWHIADLLHNMSFSSLSGLFPHLCGCACAPSARWVRCRSSRTPHTGASRWADGSDRVTLPLGWTSHCKCWLCLWQHRCTLCCLLLRGPLCPPSGFHPS